MAKSTDTSLFTANWKSADSCEKSLFDYLNSYGLGRVTVIKEALTAYFYPEIAYRNDTILKDRKIVMRAIYMLEARLSYLKNLASDLDISSSSAPSSSSMVFNKDNEDDEDDEDFEVDSYNPYDDGL